jgi:urease accessory protein
MARDAGRMRGDGPFLFAQVLHGAGVRDIADHVLDAWRSATAEKSAPVDGRT